MRKNIKSRDDKKAKIIYKTIAPPNQANLIFCISLYFAIPENYSRSNILYKYHLSGIVAKRNFLQKVKKQDCAIFSEYIKNRISKIDLSRKYFNGNTYRGQSIINKNLVALVSEIMQDHAGGSLAVKEYQKPLSNRDKFKKTNSLLEKHGFKQRIPLRKASVNEKIGEWRKSGADLSRKINDLSQQNTHTNHETKDGAHLL